MHSARCLLDPTRAMRKTTMRMPFSLVFVCISLGFYPQTPLELLRTVQNSKRKVILSSFQLNGHTVGFCLHSHKKVKLSDFF